MKLCAALVLLVACVEGKGWWMDQPYDNQEFNIRVEYGEDINITCDGDPRLADLGDYNVEYWVTPNMTILKGGDSVFFKTLDGQAGWTVSNDVKTIDLFIITEYHFGFYYCLASSTSSGDQVMVKKAVNYRGPYFDDLWEDYRLNTIVGLSSSIIFLAVAGGIYGVTMYLDYRNGKVAVAPIEEDEDEEEKKQREMEGGQGFENGAYAAEMKEKNGAENADSQEEENTEV